MKKQVLILVLFSFTVMVYSQQIDTIAAWTFPTGVDSVDIYPDIFIPVNETYYLSAEDTVPHPNTNKRDITSTIGATTFAGTAIDWNEGNAAKLWSVKIKAPGYRNLKVSSKQFSDPANPGPRDWKVQARLSGQDWVDIENGIIECGTDWNTGAIENIELPDEFDDPGNTSIFIRWIMTTNTSTSGSGVEPSGVSKIDDIYITADVIAGIFEQYVDVITDVYPNPSSNGVFLFTSRKEIKKINVYDLKGQLILEYEVTQPGRLNLGDLPSGIYFAEPILKDGMAGARKRLIVY